MWSHLSFKWHLTVFTANGMANIGSTPAHHRAYYSIRMKPPIQWHEVGYVHERNAKQNECTRTVRYWRFSVNILETRKYDILCWARRKTGFFRKAVKFFFSLVTAYHILYWIYSTEEKNIWEHFLLSRLIDNSQDKSKLNEPNFDWIESTQGG